MIGSTTGRRGPTTRITRIVMVATALVAVAAVAAPAAGAATDTSSGPTAAQRKELLRLARDYRRSNSAVITAFSPDTVVPRIKSWHAAQLAQQKALTKLSAALPAGACRTSVDALLTFEKSRNATRVKLMRDYEADNLGLVNGDVVEYAKTVPGRLQAENAVLEACGQSPVDPAAAATVATALTPAQAQQFAAAQKASATTSEKYGKVFSLPELVKDVQAIQTADGAVTDDLGTLVDELADGGCKTAVAAVFELEQQQASVRDQVVAAGQAGNIYGVIQAMGEYSKINTTSSAFTAARKGVSTACGVKV